MKWKWLFYYPTKVNQSLDTIDSLKDNITVLKSFIRILYVMPFSVTCQINKSNNKNWIEIISSLAEQFGYYQNLLPTSNSLFSSRIFSLFFCYRKREVPITCIKSVLLYDVQLILWDPFSYQLLFLINCWKTSQFKRFFFIVCKISGEYNVDIWHFKV